MTFFLGGRAIFQFYSKTIPRDGIVIIKILTRIYMKRLYKHYIYVEMLFVPCTKAIARFSQISFINLL